MQPVPLDSQSRMQSIRDFLLLALICLAVLGLQWFWLTHLERLPHGDSLYHLNLSLDYHQSESWQDLLSNTMHTKPPLIHFWSSLFYPLMGESLFASRFSLTFFWLILIPSAFGIGRHLGGKAAGWTAVALCVTSLPLLDLSLTYLPDFPLVSMVALSLYLLLKSRDGSHKSYTLLFGLSLALGALTKYSFIFFLFFPSLYLYLKALWTSVSSPLERSLHLGLKSIILALLIAWMVQIEPKYQAAWMERISIIMLLLLIDFIIVQSILFIYMAKRGREHNSLNPLFNVLQALTLAIALAGPWYLPRLPFYWNDIFFHILDYSTQAGQQVFAVNFQTCFALLPLFPPLLLLGIIAAYRNKLQAQFYLLLLSPLLSFILISLSLPEELRHIAPMVSMLLPILSLGALWLNRPLRLAAMLPVFLLCLYLVLPKWQHVYLSLAQNLTPYQETYSLMGERLAQTITRIAHDKPCRVIILKRKPDFIADFKTGSFEIDNLNYIFNLNDIDSTYALQPDTPFNLREELKRNKGCTTFILLIGKSPHIFTLWEQDFSAKGIALKRVTEIKALGDIKAKLYQVETQAYE